MTNHDLNMQILERKMRFACPTVDGHLPQATPELLALVGDPGAPMILVHRPRPHRGQARAWRVALKPLAAAVRFAHL